MENSAKVISKEPIVILGDKLKAAREAKSLDVDQVQKQTKINSRVIIALEEGRCDELLTPTYVKSFLKKYAQFLGMDQKEVLKEYSAIYKEENHTESVTALWETQSSADITNFIYGIIVIFIALAIVVSFLFFGKKAISSIKFRQQEKHIAVTLPKEKKAKASRFSQAAKQKAAVSIKSPAQKKTSSAIKKGPINLTLKIKEPVLVKVKKDGVALFSRVFSEGLSEPITADDKIELYVVKGEAVELILNGKSLGSPGKGLIKDLEITSEGVKIK